MWRDRWRITLSSAWSDPAGDGPHIRVGETLWPVRLVHHARSRRYKLIFDGPGAADAEKTGVEVKLGEVTDLGVIEGVE